MKSIYYWMRNRDLLATIVLDESQELVEVFPTTHYIYHRPYLPFRTGSSRHFWGALTIMMNRDDKFWESPRDFLEAGAHVKGTSLWMLKEADPNGANSGVC